MERGVFSTLEEEMWSHHVLRLVSRDNVILSVRFYVVRGNVEKLTKLDRRGLESRTHSAGLLFGITDAMLGL